MHPLLNSILNLSVCNNVLCLFVENVNNGEKSTEQMRDEMGYGFNRNCIYGENKDSPDVVNNLTICDGCKLYIEENVNKYNH